MVAESGSWMEIMDLILANRDGQRIFIYSNDVEIDFLSKEIPFFGTVLTENLRSVGRRADINQMVILDIITATIAVAKPDITCRRLKGLKLFLGKIV